MLVAATVKPLLVSILLAIAGSAAAEQAVTLAAVGDIQLGRGVGRMIEKEGPDYPFRMVAPLLRSADLTFGNLECALSEEGRPIPKQFSFKADPAAALGMAGAGFDLLSLANNHSMDCGREGLLETQAALAGRGIRSVGAGRDAAEAAAPVILEHGGLRIAFLARTMVAPEGVIYREDAPGVAALDPERIEDEVRAARRQADLVVVSLHWGIEYARQPQEEQRRLARRLVDAGACLVLGHHPHALQPVERYRGGLIAYSLGNFVFDAGPKGRQGAILRCTLTAGGVGSAELIPVAIREGRPAVEGRDSGCGIRDAGRRGDGWRAVACPPYSEDHPSCLPATRSIIPP